MARSPSMMIGLVALAAILALAIQPVASVPDFPQTPRGKVPPFTPNGTSGQWRLTGSYHAVANGSGEGYRYTGFQVVVTDLPGNGTAWKYTWNFENPWRSNNGSGFWSSTTAQTFEIGYSSQYPLHKSKPYVNSYVMNVTTGYWLCYHIPVPLHFTGDFLTTSVASNGSIGGAQRVAADWGTFLGDGNLFQLHDGFFDGEIVRLYLNTDRWFQCPRCGVLTAMSVTNGLMLRQYYIQPTIDFYTDYYDWQTFDNDNANFLKAFDYPVAVQNTPCVDITTGQPACWNQTASRACTATAGLSA